MTPPEANDGVRARAPNTYLRGCAALMALTLLTSALACGSTAAGTNADGGARIDGGADDGGPSADGGPSLDGGPNADGGSSVDGGPSADGGAVTWRILPGVGLDIADRNGQAAQLRIGVTRSATQTLLGDGMDTSLAVGPFDRSYADGAVFVFFANTDQSKDGSDNPTLTGADQARFMSATRASPAKTAGGTGPGSARAAWLAELNMPDLTLPNFDNNSETRDHYFARGLFIDYDNAGTATSYTVARTSRLPNERIEMRTRKLGSINALSSGGSSLAAVESAWGAPDQIDDYDVVVGVKGRNYTYVNLGLVFVGITPFLGSSYSVNSIIFFDPYYGRADVANLGVRSSKQDFDTALVTGSCPATTSTFLNQTWRVYRVGATAGGACNTKVGVVFDAQNRARTIFLGFPDNV